MHVIVTGGAGFVGARLAAALLEHGAIDGTAVSHVTSLDLAECPIDDERISSVVGDLTDPAVIESAFRDDTAAVCHLAAIVSSHAEAEFDTGMSVNFDATRALLEACRARGGLRFLFSSTLAVYGPDMATPLDENVAVQPRSSYGTQKAMCELLVNDYSRKGFVDGRVCRLPTVVVRPGRPNRAASSFASSIIREPINGEEALCPIDPAFELWLTSPRVLIDNLLRVLALDAERLAGWRTVNLPGFTISVNGMLDALERVAGQAVRERVRFERDPAIEQLVYSWPPAFDNSRALSLGLAVDDSFDGVVRDYQRETHPAATG